MKRKLTAWLLLLCLLLTGCGKAEAEPEKEALDPVVAEALSDAIRDHIQKEIIPGEDLPLMVRYNNELLQCISFRILNFNLSDKTAKVEFVYVDVLKLADSFTDPNVTQETFYTDSIEMLRTGKFETAKSVVTVSFEDSQGGYVIINSDALVNVLTGGLLDYSLEVQEGAEDGE